MCRVHCRIRWCTISEQNSRKPPWRLFTEQTKVKNQKKSKVIIGQRSVVALRIAESNLNTEKKNNRLPPAPRFRLNTITSGSNVFHKLMVSLRPAKKNQNDKSASSSNFSYLIRKCDSSLEQNLYFKENSRRQTFIIMCSTNTNTHRIMIHTQDNRETPGIHTIPTNKQTQGAAAEGEGCRRHQNICTDSLCVTMKLSNPH